MAGVNAKPRPVSLEGWHQRSGSWFGDGVRRAMPPMCFVCTSLCEKLFKPGAPAGAQARWYGRLGKQETVRRFLA